MYFKTCGIYFLIVLSYSSGDTFQCLDDCECDKSDKLIDCHNNLERTKLKLPKDPLENFSIIGLTRNNIVNLPSEEILLKKFPQLKAIDVESNQNFNCSSLKEYNELTLFSDCDKNFSNHAKVVENTNQTNLECIGECDINTPSVRDYLKRLWKLIKEKYKNLKQKSAFLRDLDQFFSSVGQRIMGEIKNTSDESKK